ncbi:hypothetical protein SLA2020_350180 [Shorea laevis]
MLKSEPVERHLKRALERTVVLLTRSNGNWNGWFCCSLGSNGNWNEWFCCSPGRTAMERELEQMVLLLTRLNGQWNGIGTDDSVSHQ